MKKINNTGGQNLQWRKPEHKQGFYLVYSAVLHFTQLSYPERLSFWGLFCTTIRRQTLTELIKSFGFSRELIF